MEDIPEQKAYKAKPQVGLVRKRFFDLDQFFLAMETTGPIKLNYKLVNSIYYVQASKLQGFHYSTNDDLVPLEVNEPVQFSVDYDQTDTSQSQLFFNDSTLICYPEWFKNLLKGGKGGWLVFNVIGNSHTNQLGDRIPGEMSYVRHFFADRAYHPAPGQVAVPFLAFCNSAKIFHKNQDNLQLFYDFKAEWKEYTKPIPSEEQ